MGRSDGCRRCVTLVHRRGARRAAAPAERSPPGHSRARPAVARGVAQGGPSTHARRAWRARRPPMAAGSPSANPKRQKVRITLPAAAGASVLFPRSLDVEGTRFRCPTQALDDGDALRRVMRDAIRRSDGRRRVLGGVKCGAVRNRAAGLNPLIGAAPPGRYATDGSLDYEATVSIPSSGPPLPGDPHEPARRGACPLVSIPSSGPPLPGGNWCSITIL